MLPLFLGVLESRLDRRWSEGWMRWSEETMLQIGNATLFSWRFRIELDLVVTAAAACH